jgi:molybdenum cofactor guanylyltransferase
MSISKQDITAVILAGGKGSRLGGQDKGLVSYHDKPLIEYILERIEAQVATVLISANRNFDIYATYGYPVIRDNMLDYQGPLAGFSTAMSIAKTECIITLPCDGPLISDDLVARLQCCLQDNPTKIAVAYDGQRLQPTYALIPITWLTNLNQFLNDGGRGIHKWYTQNQSNVIHCDFSDIPDMFTNINTEEQRRQLEQKNRKQP